MASRDGGSQAGGRARRCSLAWCAGCLRSTIHKGSPRRPFGHGVRRHQTAPARHRGGAARRVLRGQRGVPFLGPAFAVLLFARVEPLGVAWLRIATAAAIFGAVAASLAQPPLRARRARSSRWGGARGDERLLLPRDRAAPARHGRRDRVPAGDRARRGRARTRRNGLALVAAVGGVYLLTEVRLAGEPLGFVLAFANAGLFALYIVLGHRSRRRRPGVDGLAAAMLVGAVVVTPLGGWARRPRSATRSRSPRASASASPRP